MKTELHTWALTFSMISCPSCWMGFACIVFSSDFGVLLNCIFTIHKLPRVEGGLTAPRIAG